MPATATPAPTPAPSREPIEQVAGQVIVLRYAGAAVPGYVRRALREERAAGAILFADNLGGPGQLARASRTLHEAAGGTAIVCTDQEGGEVRVLRAVSGVLREALAGWKAAGVAATAKHFPGLAGAGANTDEEPVTIDDAEATLRARDLPPFAAAIDAGVPLIMSSHASYPALDPERIASQSKPILTGLLREEMGFEGVVVTDSMEAQASLESAATYEQTVERAMEAGNDLILTTGRGSSIRVYRALVKRAKADGAFATRLREAAGRVRALTETLARAR